MLFNLPPNYVPVILDEWRLPFNKAPMNVDLTKYLYVVKQIMEVNTIAIMNLISIGICNLNMKNVIKVTMGKCIRYIQYAPSEINRNLALEEPNLFSANPIKAYENRTPQTIFNAYCNSHKMWSLCSVSIALAMSSSYISAGTFELMAKVTIINRVKPTMPARK